jgi:hypothetical protein
VVQQLDFWHAIYQLEEATTRRRGSGGDRSVRQEIVIEDLAQDRQNPGAFAEAM